MTDTVSIVCPAHPQDAHTAFLHTNGHEYAGIWECPVDGSSDACEHDETYTEVVEVDTMRNGEHDTYNVVVDICTACELTVDRSEQ